MDFSGGQSNAIVEELQSIKKLLMLLTLAEGYKQKHLALVLGVSDATLSRMMPKGFAKELAKIFDARSVHTQGE